MLRDDFFAGWNLGGVGDPGVRRGRLAARGCSGKSWPPTLRWAARNTTAALRGEPREQASLREEAWKGAGCRSVLRRPGRVPREIPEFCGRGPFVESRISGRLCRPGVSRGKAKSLGEVSGVFLEGHRGSKRWGGGPRFVSVSSEIDWPP